MSAEHRTILRAIEIERERQLESFDVEHDDDHHGGELARAAAVYTLSAVQQALTDQAEALNTASATARDAFVRLMQLATTAGLAATAFEPWPINTWQPSARELLVRAGALIVAEIERLDRRVEREGLDA